MGLPHRLTAVLTACALGATMAATAGSAGAAGGTPLRSGSGDHCVSRLERIEPGGDEARIVSERCFESYADAVRSATGGAVDLPRGLSTRAAVERVNAMDGAIGTLSSFLIGQDWDDANYDPANGTKLWEASAPCAPGVAWNVSNINPDWQERISSAKGKSNCDRFYHFENANYGGAQRNCLPNCATFGVMNDATSSLQFKP